MKKNISIAIVLTVCVILLMNPQTEQSIDFTLSKETPEVRLRLICCTDDDPLNPTGGCTDDDHLIPMDGCTYDVINEIEYAKTEILVQAYSSFTSAAIAKALLNAHKRGVNIQLILVKGPKILKLTSPHFFTRLRCPYMSDDEYAIAHNKTMIIDREIVITGSFNLAEDAEEKNAENLLVIRDKGLAKVYIEKWEKHKGHLEKYSGR